MKKILFLICVASIAWTQCDEECIAGVTDDCCTHSDCGDGEYCYVSTDFFGNEDNFCWPIDVEDGCCAENDSVDTDCDGDSDYLDCPTDCFSDATGPYSVGIITEENGMRDGPDYQNGIIYYPIDYEGQLPTIVMVPGWMSFISAIEEWGPFLASYGYVTMFVNVNWPWESTLPRADALLDGIITVYGENERNNSPLFAKLNLNQIAVGGHSRGGGGAMQAATMEHSIKSVLAFSPWIENVTEDDVDFEASIFYFSGEIDDQAPNDIHTNLFYNLMPETTDKLLFEISNGDHSIATSPYNNIHIGNKALYWLEKYLMNDPSNCNFLIDEPLIATQFITNIECQLLGDLNEDGNINIVDIVIIVDMILNAPGFNSNADFNEDGNVNIVDIVLMVQFILEN